MIVLPVGENRVIVASFVSTKHRNVTEGGRTDRQRAGGTDPIIAYTAIGIVYMPMAVKIVVFEAPFGGLGATYAVHLRLNGKLVGLSLIHI